MAWMSDFRDDRPESTACWTDWLDLSPVAATLLCACTPAPCLVRCRGEVETTCATAAKLMCCFAMDVWMPLCSNLGNADLVNRAPRYLPLAVGKRWRCSRGSGWTGGCGLAGWLAAGWLLAGWQRAWRAESSEQGSGRAPETAGGTDELGPAEAGGALCGCSAVVG